MSRFSALSVAAEKLGSTIIIILLIWLILLIFFDMPYRDMMLIMWPFFLISALFTIWLLKRWKDNKTFPTSATR